MGSQSGSCINARGNATVANWQGIDVPETFIGRRNVKLRYRNATAVTGRPLRAMVRFHLPLSILISSLSRPKASVKQISAAVPGDTQRA